ncbi:beta-1,4-galactosyltransferase 2 isoform X2, partial [Tachysurus ichikawai]
ITLNGMKVSRPDVKIGRYRMIKHERDKHNEPNPQSTLILFTSKQTSLHRESELIEVLCYDNSGLPLDEIQSKREREVEKMCLGSPGEAGVYLLMNVCPLFHSITAITAFVLVTPAKELQHAIYQHCTD